SLPIAASTAGTPALRSFLASPPPVAHRRNGLSGRIPSAASVTAPTIGAAGSTYVPSAQETSAIETFSRPSRQAPLEPANWPYHAIDNISSGELSRRVILLGVKPTAESRILD
ncbi:MAG: hypothetical protein V5A21_05945, partial [Halapricum sp.]